MTVYSNFDNQKRKNLIRDLRYELGRDEAIKWLYNYRKC